MLFSLWIDLSFFLICFRTKRLGRNRTFNFQGVVDVLCEACKDLKWNNPSKIQKEAIPVALEGKDIIGLAETGSGKTGAFAIPILQALLENPQRYFALVLTPTRELAFQISEQFEALGKFKCFYFCILCCGDTVLILRLFLQLFKGAIYISTFVWQNVDLTTFETLKSQLAR